MSKTKDILKTLYLLEENERDEIEFIKNFLSQDKLVSLYYNISFNEFNNDIYKNAEDIWINKID
mgnify:CR=1 FL=1